MTSSEQPDFGHVVITLSAVEPETNFVYPNRKINLSADNSSIPVGRASKSATKGFVASESNCWWNSEVMSRRHAEIRADMEKETVSITDVSSLHGTFVNEQRLPREVPFPLNEGDQVKFGVPINLRQDIYPPTSVRVGVEFVKRCTGAKPMVFRAPDVVENGEYSDDDMSVKASGVGAVSLEPRSEVPHDNHGEGIPLASNSPATSHPDENETTNVIDLTSPTREVESPALSMYSPASPEMRSPRCSRSPSLGFSSPHRNEHAHDESSVRLPEDERLSGDQEPMELELSDEESFSGGERIPSDAEIEDSMPSASASELSDFSDEDDLPTDSDGESEMPSRLSPGSEGSSDLYDFDDDEDEYTSEDDDLFHINNDPDLEDWDKGGLDVGHAPDYTINEAPTAPVHAPVPLPPLCTITKPEQHMAIPPLQPNLVPLQDVCQNKRDACNISTILNPPMLQPALLHPLPPQPFARHEPHTDFTGSKPSMQVLGDKTGKHEFFAAREENKLVKNKMGITDQEASYPSPPNPATHHSEANSESMSRSFAPVYYEPSPQTETTRAAEMPTHPVETETRPAEKESRPIQPLQANQPMQSVPAIPGPVETPAASKAPKAAAIPIVTYMNPMAKSALLASGERFINSPPSESLPEGVGIAEDDDEGAIISAATFNQHKLNRSSLKRKADEISEDAAAAAVEMPAETAPISTGVVPATRQDAEIVEPPRKRRATSAKNGIQLVAKAAGLVALSGAMVFGSLIYAAPAL